MSGLVEQLAQGIHPVTLGGPSPDVAALKQRIEEIGYVFIKFTDTRGGTDLGVRIDMTATDLRQADFDHAQGTVHIEGTLSVDFVSVRCVADIDLATRNGSGHLLILQATQT